MTEETMREARKAFLVDALKKLLGQDSPIGFTDCAKDGVGPYDYGRSAPIWTACAPPPDLAALCLELA